MYGVAEKNESGTLPLQAFVRCGGTTMSLRIQHDVDVAAFKLDLASRTGQS